MADLTGVKPGDRFMLSAADGRVMYRGTMNADGTALMDVLSHRGIEPMVLTAQELHDTYDPEIHVLGIIGTAV